MAEATAVALTGDTLSCGTFELCAAGMINRVEIAALMSTALGRQIEAGEAAFSEWARAAHLPVGPVRDGLEAMNADYDKYGFLGGNALVLKAVLGRELRTLAAYITELVSRSI